MDLVLVAAIGENGVIGRDNALPWRLRSDLKHFRALTMGKPVVMGRRTFASIGKPLPGRTNIVVTRRADFAAPGIVVARDIPAALLAAKGDALRRGIREIMVIGGSDLFSALIGQAARLEITRVHAAPAGDTFFPVVDAALWDEGEARRHAAGPHDDADFTTLAYRRR